MPGPLAKPPEQRRRRNKPTIPTTKLPANGLSSPVPEPPDWITLGPTGSAWWDWAWRTPQAAAWSSGDDVLIARRAVIEDDRAALRDGPRIDLAAILEIEADDQTAAIEAIFRTLARLAGGKSSLDRQATDLDDRLGLNPKAFAHLHWTIVDEEAAKAKAPTPRTTTAQRKRMKVLDGGKASA